MVVASIDWTNVLVSLIVGLPAIIAAIYSARIHGEVKTPSGKTLGEVAEYAHDTGIANNLLLSAANGETQVATPEQLHQEAATAPRVPAEPAQS